MTTTHQSRQRLPDLAELIRQTRRVLRTMDDLDVGLAAWSGVPLESHVVGSGAVELTPWHREQLDTDTRRGHERRGELRAPPGGALVARTSAVVLLGRLPYRIAKQLETSAVPLGMALEPCRPRRHVLPRIRYTPDSGGGLLELRSYLAVAGSPVALLEEVVHLDALRIPR